MISYSFLRLNLFLNLISKLPFALLYGFSDFCYFIVYHVIGYRKAVVFDNLKHAFPDFSETELNRIQKNVYHSFCDHFIETVKLHSLPLAELEKRIVYTFPDELVNNASEKGSLLLTGHFFNWEYLAARLPQISSQKAITIYMPLRSKGFDKFILGIRTRFGNTLVPANNLKQAIVAYKQETCITLLLADQNPPGLDYCSWTEFFGRKIPFHLGFDRLARKTNQTVYFATIKKIKRGYYHISVEKLIENPKELAEGGIVKAYVSKLEDAIRAQPENWLWTHKRWKHFGKDKL